MLTDPKEIEIIAKAKQPNVRKQTRSRQPFFKIFEDFFDGVPMTGEYIDLGPGHYDFGELVREKGGKCVGLDSDPAVIELGRHKGFEAIESTIQSLVKKPLDRKFDGVFNKFAFNAFWGWSDDDRHLALVNTQIGLMKPEGWAWIGPWNGVPKKANLDKAIIARTLDVQRRYFEDAGFTTNELSVSQSKKYGLGGTVANNVIFTKNLEWTPKL